MKKCKIHIWCLMQQIKKYVLFTEVFKGWLWRVLAKKTLRPTMTRSSYPLKIAHITQTGRRMQKASSYLNSHPINLVYYIAITRECQKTLEWEEDLIAFSVVIYFINIMKYRLYYSKLWQEIGDVLFTEVLMVRISEMSHPRELRLEIDMLGKTFWFLSL